MKKVFILTPMEINDCVTTEKINTYIRKMSGAIKAILEEDIEVVTNFFLEPVGVDRDGEKIMQVRNRNDEIAYMAEELAAIKECDYIAAPDYVSNAFWSCNYEILRNMNTQMNGREVITLPIHVIEPVRVADEYIGRCRPNRRIY